ncbi:MULTISPECIES: DUF3558 domain-containing protein [unclassified Nocardia]|uniref:DUF3558 domain-containing protein n=1 Tax=unclassified Nocardia TaxID=2637762 RepID=UPI001CE3F3D0|nr:MULTISPECIES: DUF3558 domain-containing protein [unclassified Nocardia]
MGRQATATIAALTGVLLLASGCGPDKQGQPTPSAVNTSATAAALWDPCTQLSDQTLQSVGLVPATKRSGVAGVEEPGFKVCSWNNKASSWDFTVGVFSTVHSVDDYKKKPENVDFSNVTISGRDGFKYRTTTDKLKEDCDFVFPAAQGAIAITTIDSAASKNQTDPCGRATTVIEALVPLFPR